MHSLSTDSSLLPSQPETIAATVPTYWYEGRCPHTGKWLRLPRTPAIEAIAQDLMAHLAQDDIYNREGKMYGVLLVNTPVEQRVFKAFSGLLQGRSVVPGWVPPIPGRDQVAAAEAQTLADLAAIKEELINLQQLPERQHYAQLSQQFAAQIQAMTQDHARRKQVRHQQRQHLGLDLAADALTIAALDDQSRQDGRERRQLKHQRDRALHPLQQVITQADARIRALKQQRQHLSRQLQAQMHASYWLTNGWGEAQSLAQLFHQGIPTGTGDCCAPKLLHYAASQGFQPLAMAEFWWGLPSSQGDKVPGTFYGACADRCQPLMGFLLSGMVSAEAATIGEEPVPIVYEDDMIVVVNKPAGLLSVPGRHRDRQDSVVSRLRYQWRDRGLEEASLVAVHRIDRDTSGLLLLAKDSPTERLLRQQFQQRTIEKYYEAILAGILPQEQGVIDLPLSADLQRRPYQQVDRDQGKPSLTHFRVIARTSTTTRVEFQPMTGRTHQLRVHAADAQGLGIPILGDGLYGVEHPSDRLRLHARSLRFFHPHNQQVLTLEAAPPF